LLDVLWKGPALLQRMCEFSRRFPRSDVDERERCVQTWNEYRAISRATNAGFAKLIHICVDLRKEWMIHQLPDLAILTGNERDLVGAVEVISRRNIVASSVSNLRNPTWTEERYEKTSQSWLLCRPLKRRDFRVPDCTYNDLVVLSVTDVAGRC